MKERNVVLLCVLLFILVNNSTQAQQTTPLVKPTIEAVKIETPFELTGKMDNPAWDKAIAVELNYEYRPGDNTPAKQKTFAKVLYDNDNIYFGFNCLDSDPKSIRANISDRDKIFQDDYVIIAVDTYGDYQKSYEFAVNPYGNQGDLLATINGEDGSMDYVWYSAASLNDNGWTAEMKIPFKSLSFPNKEEQTWPLHLIRSLPRDSRYQVSWMPIDRNIPTFMPQAGLLKGLKNIEGGGNIELLPYAIGEKFGELTDRENPNSGFKFNDLKGRVGIGLKYSPSPNLAVEGVLNPDFSQIEADAEQIEVNTTFALNYDEKRPFFLTGNDLLQTPMYYSRSINNPLGAARILGKNGKLSYLLLSAYDRNTVIEIPGEERSNIVSTNMKSVANVGRLRYDFGDDTYIGGLALSRNIDSASNYVLGLDWNYKFMGNWFFSGEGFLSKTKELNDIQLFDNTRKFGNTNFDAAFNGESYSGDGIHLVLSHDTRNYEFTTVLNNFSPTYQTYNGLFGQVNYRQIYMEHEYKFYPENSFIDNWGIAVQGDLQFNYDGLKKEQYVMPQIYFTMKGQTNLTLSYLLVNDENFNRIWFQNINRLIFNFNTRPTSVLYFYFNGQVGNFIYRSSKAELGEGHNFYTGFTVRPTSRINLSFDYSRGRLSSKATKNLFYDGNIYRLVGIYQFSSEMFLRLITQYNGFNKAFHVYPLFSYKLNPFTTFYAGATSTYLDYDGFGIKNTTQQYFIKMQYLLGI